MLFGVFLGLLAGALWGLIYVAPLFLENYHPVLIALGRFIVFGSISIPFLLFLRHEITKFNRRDVTNAFLLPFFGNVIFYILITLCVRLSGAALAGMLMAVIPVTVAIAGNLRNHGHNTRVPWKYVTPPLFLIVIGLIIANWQEVQTLTISQPQSSDFWLGLGFGIASVISWTWFSIANAEWLLTHPKHSVTTWTALQGVTVLPVVLIGFAYLAWGLEWMDTSSTFLGPNPIQFVLVLGTVGVLCSWIAMLCWNQMSQRLPSSLGGQLIVFESIAAVAYALIWHAQWPTVMMVVGYSILLLGVSLSLYVFRRKKEAPIMA